MQLFNKIFNMFYFLIGFPYNFFKKYPIIISVLIISLYFAPYLIKGQNSIIRIHDNLDANISWMKMHFEGERFFAVANDENIQPLNGIKKYLQINLNAYPFLLFGYYWGYVVNKIIMSLVAFIGMILLLKKYFLKDYYDKVIHYGTSLCFALLPFWSFTLTIAGLPLLFYTFLNLRNNEFKKQNFIIVGLMPFYSSIVLSGLFIIILFSVLYIYDLISSRKIITGLFWAILVFTALTIVANYELFFSFFSSGSISHRSEFLSSQITNFKGTIKLFIKLLTGNGISHAFSFHGTFILPVSIAALLFQIATKKFNKTFLIIAFLIILFYLIHALLFFAPVSKFYSILFQLIFIRMERISLLTSFLWYVLLTLSIVEIIKYDKRLKKLLLFTIILQIGLLFINHESLYYANSRNTPSFTEFYAENQFSRVKELINTDFYGDKAICIGLEPAIANFNGIFTLDAYHVNYPLEYKRKIRSIIQGELNKNERIKNYFNNFGSRCYFFVAQTDGDAQIRKNNNITIEHLDFDYDKLLELNGRYIISAVEINTNINNRLRCIEKVIDNRSAWDIYLYEVTQLNTPIEL